MHFIFQKQTFILDRWIIFSKKEKEKRTYVQIIDSLSVSSCSKCPSVQKIQTSGTLEKWDIRCRIHTLVPNWVNPKRSQNSNLYIERIKFL